MEPFRVDVADQVLHDLQWRLKRTHWVDDFVNAAWRCGTNTAHPGVEVAYVLRGQLEYQFDGEVLLTLDAGESETIIC